MGDHILFFYGTLMAPQILHRVIHGSANPEPWQKTLLTFKPAILHGYRRHRVRGADYPGIVPSTTLASNTLSQTDPPNASSNANSPASTSTTGDSAHYSVLGTVVSGLTPGDIHRLDIFEGAEYTRTDVKVRILRESLPDDSGHHPTSTASTTSTGERRRSGPRSTSKHDDTDTDRHLRDVLDAAGAEFADEAEEISAVTYVWVAGHDRLESAEWDFEAFKRDKMAWWVGDEANYF